MGKHKKAALRKAPGNAFDTALGLSAEQLADLQLWCSRSYQHAADQAAAEWGIKLSISQLYRWFHRNDKLTLLKTLGSSAALATEIVTATESEAHDPLLACEKAISAMALKALSGEITREEMELALELFKTALESRTARTRGSLKERELELAVNKYRDSLKTKLDLAMDEFANVLKHAPALLEEFNTKFRPKVNAATAK